MAARIVGYLEYAKSLENLDTLVQMCSKEELQALDEIVKDRDEFAVYSNLSRKVQSLPRVPQVGQSTGADNHERRGLAWVTALARVELGAILVGFTHHRAPFATIHPDAFDYAQSLELLLDGVQTHFGALEGDPNLKRVARSAGRIIPALAYSRRVRLARTMLNVAMAQGPSLYSPAQAQQLKSWQRDLDDIQYALLAKIKEYLAARVSQSTDTQNSEFARACGRQLQAERSELQAGTARVRSLSR